MENILGRGENMGKVLKSGSFQRFMQIEQPGPGEGRLNDEVRVQAKAWSGSSSWLLYILRKKRHGPSYILKVSFLALNWEFPTWGQELRQGKKLQQSR